MSRPPSIVMSTNRMQGKGLPRQLGNNRDESCGTKSHVILTRQSLQVRLSFRGTLSHNDREATRVVSLVVTKFGPKDSRIEVPVYVTVGG